ncbi:MAG: aminotransferase class III-fold pyridoxal phosphate-dependent enzyme, partial [Woeseiaceae bacterium]
MSSVFYRDLGHEYPVAVRGEGMYLYSSAGDQYLDMSGGAAVSALGHGHAAVVDAVRNQIGDLAFAHTAFFTNGPQEELAERLVARFAEPGARIYFTSGGSEANETALKLAWQYWQAAGRPGKTTVISRQFSYHGNTLGALSVTGKLSRRVNYDNVLHDWPRIVPCYAYRHRNSGETDDEYGRRAAGDLRRAIERIGAENTAAFIAEPVVGATLGAVPAVDAYFREIRSICDEHDVLFIADEVMCGSGRTGTFFAHEQDGVLPDIVT